MTQWPSGTSSPAQGRCADSPWPPPKAAPSRPLGRRDVGGVEACRGGAALPHAPRGLFGEVAF